MATGVMHSGGKRNTQAFWGSGNTGFQFTLWRGLKKFGEGDRNILILTKVAFIQLYVCVKSHGVVCFQWVPLFVYVNYTSTLTCKKSTAISNIFWIKAVFSSQPKSPLLAQPPHPTWLLFGWTALLPYVYSPVPHAAAASSPIPPAPPGQSSLLPGEPAPAQSPPKGTARAHLSWNSRLCHDCGLSPRLRHQTWNPIVTGTTL